MTYEPVMLAVGILVICLALGVNAVGALVWSRAVSAAHQARANGNEVRAQETTLRYAADAIDNAEPPPQVQRRDPPISDAELKRAQIWQTRMSEMDGEEEEPPSADDRPNNDDAFAGGLFAEEREA